MERALGVKPTHYASSPGILLEGNPSIGFPSNAHFVRCLPSEEHLVMNPKIWGMMRNE
jgi:hypothetical protein